MALESISSITTPSPIANIDKEEARKRIAELKQKQKERLMDTQTPEELERQRNEILKLNPQKVLVVCHAGVFRSGMVAEILNSRGYIAKNTGTMQRNEDIAQNLAEFESLIFMSKDREDEFKDLYGITEFQVPTRIIGIAESADLHDSNTRQLEVEKAETKLDNLGFINKNPAEN